jgi:hypothetical protein
MLRSRKELEMARTGWRESKSGTKGRKLRSKSKTVSTVHHRKAFRVCPK